MQAQTRRRWLAGASLLLFAKALGQQDCQEVAVLTEPKDVAVDSDGRVYVAHGSSVSRIDLTNHHIVASLTSTSKATGIALDSTGRIILSHVQQNSITVGMQGSARLTVITGLHGPEGLALDTSENLYVADSWNHRVLRFNKTDDTWSSEGVVVATGQKPTGLVVHGSSIYVAEQQGHFVKRWDPPYTSYTVVAGTGSPGNGLDQLKEPKGLAMDELGILYVSEKGNRRVLAWRPGASHGVWVVGWGHGYELDEPVRMAVKDHHLYVPDKNKNRVLKCSLHFSTTATTTVHVDSSTTSMTESPTTSMPESSTTSKTLSSTSSETESSTTSMTESSTTSMTQSSTSSGTQSSTTSETESSTTSMTESSTTSMTQSSTTSETQSSTTSETDSSTTSSETESSTTSMTESSTISMTGTTSSPLSSTSSMTESSTSSEALSSTTATTQGRTTTMTDGPAPSSSTGSQGTTTLTAASRDPWTSDSQDPMTKGAESATSMSATAWEATAAALSSSLPQQQEASSSDFSTAPPDPSGGGTTLDPVEATTDAGVPTTTSAGRPTTQVDVSEASTTAEWSSAEWSSATATAATGSEPAQASPATSTKPAEADASSTLSTMTETATTTTTGRGSQGEGTTATTTLQLRPEDLLSQAKEEEESLLRQLWREPERNVTSSERQGTVTTVYKLDRASGGSLQLPVHGTQGSVTVPVSALDGHGEVAAVVSLFSQEAVAQLKAERSGVGETRVPSSVVNVDLYSASGRLVVKDLAEPILVYIPRSNKSKAGEECAWWDESQRVWSTDGLTTSRGKDGGLICATKHLTLFASILRGFLQALTCTRLSLLSAEGFRKLADRDWMSRPIAACLWLLLLSIFCLFLMAFEMDRKRRHIFKDTSFLVPLSPKHGDAAEEDINALRETRTSWLEEAENTKPGQAATLAKMAADQFVMMSLRRQTSALLWLSDDAVDFVCKNTDFQRTMITVRQQESWEGAKAWIEPWHELQHTVAEGMSKQWQSLDRYCSVPLIAIRIFVQAVPVVSVFLLCPFRSSCLRMLLLTTKVFGSLSIGALFFQASGEFLDKDADPACRPEGGFAAMIGRIIAIGIVSLVLAALPVLCLSHIHQRRFVKVDYVDGPRWKKQLKKWRMLDVLLWTLALLYCGFCLFFIMLFVANLHSADSVTWGTSGLTSVFKDEVIIPCFISVSLPLIALAALHFAKKLAVLEDLRLMERVQSWRLLVEHPGSQWPLHAI